MTIPNSLDSPIKDPPNKKQPPNSGHISRGTKHNMIHTHNIIGTMGTVEALACP